MRYEELYSLLPEFMEKEHKHVVGYIRKIQHSWDLAEECVQHAYAEALEKAEGIESPQRLKSWIITVAKRKAIRQIEEHKRVVAACARLVISSNAVDMDDNLTQYLVSDIYVKVLKEFPEYYGEVMRLRYVEERPYKEIAELLHISSNRARAANHRVTHRMRRELQRAWDEMRRMR